MSPLGWDVRAAQESKTEHPSALPPAGAEAPKIEKPKSQSPGRKGSGAKGAKKGTGKPPGGKGRGGRMRKVIVHARKGAQKGGAKGKKK